MAANNFLAGDQYNQDDPYGTGSGQSQQTPPPQPPPQSGNSNVPAPGNDANQIQGWASKFLGRNFTDQDIQGLQGQPLDLVMHNIANSPEAMAYAQKNQQGPYAPGNQPSSQPGGLTQAGGNFASAISQRDPRSDDLYNLLMGRAKQGLNVDPNDPIIKGQTDAYSANNQRAQRSYLSQAAEHSGPNANLEGVGRSIAEQGAQATGGLQASLMQNELTSRRNEIQQALQESGSLLTSDQQLQLQRELGLIDANLKQQGINSNNDQFTAQLGLNKDNMSNYWDWLRSGGQAG